MADDPLDSIEGKLALAKKAGAPWVIAKAPYDTAKLFRRELFTIDGLPVLHYHRGGFYLWNGSSYPELENDDIRARVYDFLDQCISGGKAVRPNRNQVSDLLDALKAVTLLPSNTGAPVWLKPNEFKPIDIIACANGLLHLPTQELIPCTPSYFNYNALEFGYNVDAPQPVEWLKFLNELWEHDQESIDTLQEIFGYYLVSDTSYQKAFLLVGPKRSGKGTIARVLARLVGNENTVAPTVNGLGTQFGLQPLIGKQAAIISDARLGNRTDPAIVTERLLSITGEDRITADRKNRTAWTGQFGVRFLILTNELPRLSDVSGALASRFIVIILEKSFFGKEDLELGDRLFAELPGILNWAIEGLHRLRARKRFVQPKSADEAVQELEDLGSPQGAFVRKKCDVGPGYSATPDELFESWEAWCLEQRRHQGDKQTFGRNLRALIPGLEIKQKWQKGRYYEGIRLKAEDDKIEDENYDQLPL